MPRHGRTRLWISYHVSSGAVRALSRSCSFMLLLSVKSARRSRSGGRAPRSGSGAKALAQRARAFALQNFRKRLREQIPQRDVALVIETARHRRAVGEHAELVAQTVAELCRAPVR